jgi:hypothetical protein
MWRVMIIPVIAALVIVIVFREKINQASGKTGTQKE